MNENTVREKYTKITNYLIKNKLTITTMESCTSGQIASLITDTEGSSAVLKGALITYSNEAKILQGVPAEIIDGYGVYSEETARAMAKAAARVYPSDIALGITGTMANPDPQNPDSIPGEVCFAIKYKEIVTSYTTHIKPCSTRYEYKLSAADKISDTLIDILKIT